MFKVVATTRKGNIKKTIARKLSEADAKKFVRERDWFYVDHLNRFYDLAVVAM